MNKILNWIEGHTKLIMILMGVVIVLQCCGRCTKKQELAFKDVQISQISDSLSNIIYHQNDSISILNTRIADLSGRNEQLIDANKSLKNATNRPIIIKN